MRTRRVSAALILGASLAVLAGCAVAPPPPPPPIPVVPPRSPLSIAPSYLFEDVIGGRAARAKRARAAGIKPLAPGAVADYVTRQETELRRQTAGTGVDVLRSGNLLLLRLPSALAFDVGSGSIKPQAMSSLSEIGLTLKGFNQSLVDVLGHTDSTGTPASNEALSKRRADAVAAHLRSRGVAQARIATRGYAATQPIADNMTEAGRTLNRRVEIKLVPLT